MKASLRRPLGRIVLLLGVSIVLHLLAWHFAARPSSLAAVGAAPVRPIVAMLLPPPPAAVQAPAPAAPAARPHGQPQSHAHARAARQQAAPSAAPLQPPAPAPAAAPDIAAPAHDAAGADGASGADGATATAEIAAPPAPAAPGVGAAQADSTSLPALPPAPQSDSAPPPQAETAASSEQHDNDSSTGGQRRAAVPAPQPAPVINASEADLPRSAHLVYDTTGTARFAGISLTLHGITTTDWHFDGGHFESSLRNDTAEFGQTSAGRFLVDAGLEPERYTEKRRHRTIVATNFDWDGRQISFSDSAAVLPSEPGIQDRLSVQFQLAVLRQADPARFVPGVQFWITVAGTHDLSQWLITVRGDETLETPRGIVRTTRIQSSRPQAESSEAMDMWLSADLHWFPTRVRLVDSNGDVIDSILHSVALE